MIVCTTRHRDGLYYRYEGIVDGRKYSFRIPAEYGEGMSDSDHEKRWKDGLQRCADLEVGKDGGPCPVP